MRTSLLLLLLAGSVHATLSTSASCSGHYYFVYGEVNTDGTPEPGLATCGITNQLFGISGRASAQYGSLQTSFMSGGGPLKPGGPILPFPLPSPVPPEYYPRLMDLSGVVSADFADDLTFLEVSTPLQLTIMVNAGR